MYEEAIAVLEKAVALIGGSNLRHKASLGHFHALSGRSEEARRILEELLEIEKRRHVSPLSIAFIYLGMNEKGQALQRFEEAYEVRNSDMFVLNVSPVPFIRSHPRVQALLRRMNFPE
jgi:tetratricopeptide (TPR) repeat protein